MNLYKVLFPNRIGDKWFNEVQQINLVVEIQKIDDSDKFIFGEIQNDKRKWNSYQANYEIREIICSEEQIKQIVKVMKDYCKCDVYYFKECEVLQA